MNKIKSFTIDHRVLQKGVYVSNEVNIGGVKLTTFDIRLCAPYKDAPLDPMVSHTIEHIGATYFRNLDLKDREIIYFGPMGCLTGFYLIVSGEITVDEVHEMILGMIREVLNTSIVPGAKMKECGNYTYMDLDEAKEVCGKLYYKFLRKVEISFSYPDEIIGYHVIVDVGTEDDIKYVTNTNYELNDFSLTTRKEEATIFRNTQDALDVCEILKHNVDREDSIFVKIVE